MEMIGILIAIMGISIALLFEGTAWYKKKDTIELGKHAVSVGVFLAILGLFWGVYTAWKLWGPWHTLGMLVYVGSIAGIYWILHKKL